MRNLLALGDGTEAGQARKRRLDDVMQMNRTEFQANNLDIGYYYAAGAIVEDGSRPCPPDPTGLEYIPTTRPGHRLPHAYIQRKGEIVSTLDLVQPGFFTLITQPESAQSWGDAIESLPEHVREKIKLCVVGDSGEFIDHNHNWRMVREIEESGAVLIRPDQHVAWRAFSIPENPSEQLAKALEVVLGDVR